MIIQNEDLETRLKVLENGKNQIVEETENIENTQLEKEEFSQLFVNTITKMITQKWHIKIKHFIKPNFQKSLSH